MNEKLKFCPFCGGEAKVRNYSTCMEDWIAYLVYCSQCNISTRIYEIKQEAINAWNTRVTLSKTEMVETNEEISAVEN